MAKSTISQAAVHIIHQVERGEMSPSEANEKLLDLILKSESVSDLNFTHAARDGIKRLEKIWGNTGAPENP